MNRTSKYIALAVLVLGFTACSQDNDIAQQQQDDIVKIASASIATELQTRVNTLDDGTAWESGDQILLVNNSRNKKKSGTYTYGGSAWSLTDGIVLYAYDTDTTNDFTAYYPATSDADYTLPIDQSDETKIKSADRMIAKASKIANGAAVALSFERQNAKVTITPTLNTEFDSSATISKLTIGNITPYHPESAAGYTAIIAPATNGFTVTVVVNTGGTEHELEATTSTAIEAGKHYTFNLTVGKEAMTFGNITIGEWDTPVNDAGKSNVTEVIRYTVWGTTAVIDIVSSDEEGVQNAISDLLANNTSVTTVTVNGTLNADQQRALAAALSDFSGTLVMDMTDVADAISNLTCTQQLGGYTYDGTTTTYTVYTEAGLNTWREAVAENVATNLTLGADIILSTVCISVDANGKPSGSNWTYVQQFKGTLDGAGHSIVNLRIYDKTSASFIRGIGGSATIKNLTFVNPIIYGEYDEYTNGMGTFVGSVTDGSIINCHVQGGSVTCTTNHVGGLIGFTSNSGNIYVCGCSNSAKVTGEYHVGGIIGNNERSNSVAACANTGEISGKSSVGGIVGHAIGSNIIACYTTKGNIIGAVTANQVEVTTVTGSYYIASKDTDEIDGTTPVADESELNSTEVVTDMNSAIDTHNNSATEKLTYKWKVGATLPELEAVTASE